ncbi:MarR family transcriptional regulator [Acuticoccus sediminis]|uniref:MarR family transcriptional regulator n=1 Tax=Acuticoccus sediminis TaxID=2184697 RepID=A0A8B2NJI7_9HYPH|nr:MarR family transcriptional regulator [Acuticoccus sediminis]RAH97812.1 MarR family transcriptional regulator [Acuticoccus sediminis]
MALRSDMDEDGEAATGGPDDVVAQGIRWWNTEKPELDTQGKAILGRIIALQDRVTRRYNAALAPFGLRYTEYAVLATLRAHGRHIPMSPTELRETMLFTSGGLSNLLRRLAERGLIARTAAAHDGRGVTVSLTDQGAALADMTMPVQVEADQDLIAGLDEGERHMLESLLTKLIRSKPTGEGF